MLHLRTIFLILLLNASIPIGFGQHIVSGVVRDSLLDVIPGAQISIQGAYAGTLTDINGNFSIHIKDSATLRFHYIGFKDTLIEVSRNTAYLEVVLQEDHSLDEVEVICWSCNYEKTFTLGYRSDISTMPIGFLFEHKWPRYYKWNRTIIISLGYKTNLAANNEVKLSYQRNNSFQFRRFKFHYEAIYHARSMKSAEPEFFIQDLQLSLNPYLRSSLLETKLGAIIRHNNGATGEMEYAPMLGMRWKVWRRSPYLMGKVSFFKEYTEYAIGLRKAFRLPIEGLKFIDVGLEYSKYLHYEEINFQLLFTNLYR